MLRHIRHLDDDLVAVEAVDLGHVEAMHDLRSKHNLMQVRCNCRVKIQQAEATSSLTSFCDV